MVITIMIQPEDIANVALEAFELSRAATLGIQRQIHNLYTRKADKHACPTTEGFHSHILGACGELAVAKALGVYWPGVLGSFEVPDVGTIQVRTTDRPGGSLILHKDDPDNDPFVLVVGSNREFRIVGWLYGHEGKHDRFWRTEDVCSPAYFINPKGSIEARKLFRPIATLPDLVKRGEGKNGD